MKSVSTIHKNEKKAIVLLNCKNKPQWFFAWACYLSFNKKSESLFLPVLEGQEFVKNKIKHFAIMNGIGLCDFTLKEFLLNNANLQLKKEFAEAAYSLRRVGIPKEHNSMFLSFLWYYTKATRRHDFVRECPKTIDETLTLYRMVGYQVDTGEGTVIAIGKAGVLGGSIFSIVKRRKLIIAEDIKDVEKNLTILKPSSLTFAIDKDIFTLSNSQRIRNLVTKLDIPLGFLYCYDAPIAIWFAVKLKLYDCFCKKHKSQLIADFYPNFLKGEGHYYFSSKSDRKKLNHYSMLSKSYEAVALRTHSNGMDTYAGGKYCFCSRKLFNNTLVKKSKVIVCFNGAKCRHNHIPLTLLASGRFLSCRTFFACACLGLMLSDSYLEQEFSESHAILCSEKLNSFIATDRIITGSSLHLLYFYFLYNSGIKLGHLTNILNKFHSFMYKERNPFILFGDPEVNIPKNNFLKAKDCKCTFLTHGMYQVSFIVNDIQALRKKGVILDLSGTDMAQFLCNSPIFVFQKNVDNTLDNPLLEGVLERNKEQLLFFLTTREETSNQKRFELLLSNTNLYFHHEKCFKNILLNLYFWQFFLLATKMYLQDDDVLKKAGVQLLASIPQFCLTLIQLTQGLKNIQPECIYSCKQLDANIEAATKQLEEFHKLIIIIISRLSRYIATTELTKTWKQFSTCKDKEQISGRCRYCNSFLHICRYDNLFGIGGTRTTVYCKCCEFVADVTNIGKKTFIDGDKHIKCGTYSSYTVKIKNMTTFSIHVDAIMLLQDLHTREHTVVCPAISKSLHPDQTVYLKFKIEIPQNFISGCYLIFCYILVNGGYNLVKKIVFLEK